MCLIHSNTFIGKIFVFELDPNTQYRYQSQISFPLGNQLRLQVIDNLLVVHNLDTKSTNLYDFKIVDYHIPLLKPNLTVDTSLSENYISDLFLPEEIPVKDDEVNALGLKNQTISVEENKEKPESALVIEEEKKEI